MDRAQTYWLGLAAVFAITGCSAILDTDAKQCTKDLDCGEVNGQPVASCERNFCVAYPCTTDAECRTRGDLVCEMGSCAAPDCTTNEQCGAGLSCSEGRCVDPILGCFFDKPSTATTEEPVYRVQVTPFIGERIEGLSVVACDLLDPLCARPVPNVTLDYDYHWATIRGLSNGQRYVLRFTGNDEDGVTPLLPTDFVMIRPVVGMTEEVDSLQLVPTYIPAVLAEGSDVAYDPKKGVFVGQVFGCDNKQLAGVSATDNRTGTLFYLTGEGPTYELTETEETGQFGFINMEVTESGQAFSHKITLTYGGQPLYSYTVSPRPGVLTFMLMYMPDYGSTDRLRMP
jgi:hypothetical protein